MFGAYRLLLAGAFPLVIVYVLWRILRNPSYARNLSERFGMLPHSFQRTAPTSIWLHAVSAGEVLSSVELIRRMRAEMAWGAVFVSTGTLAGRRAAEEKLAGLVDGIFYAPFDYVFFVRKVLRRIRPLLLIVIETEVWPNLYREAKRTGAGLAIVNARMSPAAALRYRRLRWFFRAALSLPDRILVQNAAGVEAFAAAGAPADRVEMAGNLKYDFQPSLSGTPGDLDAHLESPLWIAASTCGPELPGDPDEDDAVIAAYGRLREEFEGLRLLIAPRKPERFEAVARKLDAAALPYLRRSTMNGKGGRVVLLDTIGELSGLFGRADVVFVGGTLPRRGGHNIVEPALYGKAVVIGPHMENFPDVAGSFRTAGAVAEISSAGELEGAVRGLLGDRERRESLGKRALREAESQRGATGRTLEALKECYDGSVPRNVPRAPWQPLLWLLARFWDLGSRRSPKAKRLSLPVISVGGISMGGSGKTPLVRRIARELGEGTAVLTRGYRRQTPESSTIVAAGTTAPVELTGDEPQLILRDGYAALGIGADRLRTGRILEMRQGIRRFVLDDGFQHRQLHRDMDIVLIDGLDPLAGGGVFPLGRLREMPAALGRASAVVVTRAERGRRYTGIERLVRKNNTHAGFFRAETAPLRWKPVTGGSPIALDALKTEDAGAFCGLANPASFWRTLEQLGYRPRVRLAFGDHHRYSYADLTTMTAHKCSVWLTTEKDAVNLPGSAATMFRAFALEISINVDGDFFTRIREVSK